MSKKWTENIFLIFKGVSSPPNGSHIGYKSHVFPAIIFSIITCSISIKNHIQLEKSTIQVVTELDFWFLYFFFKEFFYSTDIFEPKIMCDNSLSWDIAKILCWISIKLFCYYQ